MRFKTIAFALIVSSAVFILGCDDDEDCSTIGGGGKLSFQVNADTTQIVVQSEGVVLISQEENSQYTTGEVSVTKGQNIIVAIYGRGQCANRQVRALLNGNQFDERTWNLGSTLNSCPDGFVKTYNFIIP
tara:strand:- start:75 stop:464 length:390 start_codon:yes stop_codon:yes gene_type:complete